MCYDSIVFDNDGVLTYPTPQAVLQHGVEDAFLRFNITPDDDVVSRMIDADVTQIQQVARRYNLDPNELWKQREKSVAAAQRRKPNPEYLTDALNSIGVSSGLYVGDSNVDILAADRAGMDVAFIRRPHRTEYDLVAEPTYEINSLEELASIAV